MAAETQNTATVSTRRKPKRVIILLAVLAIVLCFWAYDLLVAQPGSQRGYEIVSDLVSKQTSASLADDPITIETVQELLGKAPSRRHDTDHYTIETYSWRRGALVLTYDVNVVYKPNGKGQLAVFAPYLNEEPPESALPGYSIPKEEIDRATKTYAPMDPSAGDPSAGDPTAGDPSAEDPSAGHPSAEDPPTEDPPAEDPPVEDPSAANPSARSLSAPTAEADDAESSETDE